MGLPIEEQQCAAMPLPLKRADGVTVVNEEGLFDVSVYVWYVGGDA